MQTETMKVTIDGNDAVINKSDFDPKVHKVSAADRKAGAADPADGLTDEERSELDRLLAKRRAQANVGQVDGSGHQVDTLEEVGRNTSGTFSEPTPTDIRFPNKDATEFENNHGAFAGRSAAEIREAAGLPDAPGGIVPQVAIPDGWRSMKDSEIAEIGEKIRDAQGGDATKKMTPAQARKVIETELQTRTSAPAEAATQEPLSGSTAAATGGAPAAVPAAPAAK